MAKAQNLIVGCGISGATLARALADVGMPSTVIDSRPHIAGNVYDYRQSNIWVHKYGTHIFHTNNKQVWDFVNRFCTFHPYQHRVLGAIDGKLAPIPFNLNSLHILFPSDVAARTEQKLISTFGRDARVPILELRRTTDTDLQHLADYVYRNVFLGYTMKQWGRRPDEIDPSVSARVPVVVSRDDRYFNDLYQGVPIGGYTAMVEKMLSHDLITVHTNTPFDATMEYENLYWTGSIDEFFGYKFGRLPYRSERFVFAELPISRFQDAAVVNYPCSQDYTRIGEYKWFLDDQSPSTIISYEYPEAFIPGQNEPYYPISNPENDGLYRRYLACAADMPNVHFCGRLGDYKYYDMDGAIARCLQLVQKGR